MQENMNERTEEKYKVEKTQAESRKKERNTCYMHTQRQKVREQTGKARQFV